MAVTLQADGCSPISAQISDLSNTGMFVRTHAHVPLKRTVTLTFTLGADRTCAARGTVVRSQMGMGIDFLEKNEDMQEFLDDVASLRPELVPEFLAAVISPVLSIS
jgi:hypothetical protein